MLVFVGLYLYVLCRVCFNVFVKTFTALLASSKTIYWYVRKRNKVDRKPTISVTHSLQAPIESIGTNSKQTWCLIYPPPPPADESRFHASLWISYAAVAASLWVRYMAVLGPPNCIDLCPAFRPTPRHFVHSPCRLLTYWLIDTHLV